MVIRKDIVVEKVDGVLCLIRHFHIEEDKHLSAEQEIEDDPETTALMDEKKVLEEKLDKDGKLSESETAKLDTMKKEVSVIFLLP